MSGPGLGATAGSVLQLSGGAFRVPRRRIAELQQARPPDDDGSDSGSCHTILSSVSSHSKPATRARKWGRQAEDSTVCSSGFSDVLLPGSGSGSGPVLQAVLAVRRRHGQEEYLLKLRGRSHAKARWWTKDEATHTLDKAKLQGRVRKYLADHKVEPFVDYEPGPDPFPQMYTVKERLVSLSQETLQALVLWKGLEYNSCTWEPLDEVPAEKLEHYRAFQKRRVVQPREVVKLRPYQEEGVAWMRRHHSAGHGGILGDDMGLGKTIQTVTFVASIVADGRPGPFLVVAPKSLLPHWVDEFGRWSGLNAVCYSGAVDSKKILVQFELLTRGGQILPHVVVTNYENLSDKVFNLSARHWEAVIFDEAHRLKNPAGQIWNCARKLTSKCKVLLTGTPVQNNMGELWALLHIAHPAQFSEAVRKDFATMLDKRNVSTALHDLRKSTEPYILRRTKDVVLKGEIPDRTDTHINIELTAYQRIMYTAVIAKSESVLMGQGRLGSMLAKLRCVCNHPFLVEGARERAEERLAGQAESSGIPPVIACSAKAIVLDKILRKWRTEGRKVLIFSQWKIILDLIEECLEHRGWEWVRLDGGVKGDERQQQISRFNSSAKDPFVFLLTTRAGGSGLNLTVADRVVIYDTDWNPQQDLQAAARCHRIGQEKEVKIFRFVSVNTVEEKMVEVASQKLALSNAVLSSQGEKMGAYGVDEGELRSFLRKGALKLKAGNAAQSDRLLIDTSADAILDRAHQGLSATGMKDIQHFSEVTVSAAEIDPALERSLRLPPTPPPTEVAVPIDLGRKGSESSARGQAGSPTPVAPGGTPRLVLYSSRKRSHSQSEQANSPAASPGSGTPSRVRPALELTFSRRRSREVQSPAVSQDQQQQQQPPQPRLELTSSRVKAAKQAESAALTRSSPQEKRPRLLLRKSG
eukprot:TRINITY_DN5383_c0_g2_i1.p1 TRINITY_DN5383_c0_g2~~TRINITY_DN5383_c0_g2_i1.p1  ORF type:complete len:922 (+),score=299.84 TRINITY_DN5383_c0_g2_i1:66-2831(+)